MSGAESGAEASKPALPPQSIVGKDIVNTDGEEIGEVTEISGDQVIASVGGFLGMGAHDVALNWSDLTMTGSGEDMKLETSFTKDELKKMPKYTK
jgi:sporulation protein YlmC with PRC-barrel domain